MPLSPPQTAPSVDEPEDCPPQPWTATKNAKKSDRGTRLSKIGLRLVAPDDGWRNRQDVHPEWTRGFRAAIVARARFVEDLVLEQAGRGVGQYVILGAGLDTFAERRPEIASRLRVFEVDRPAPQEWKRRRLVRPSSKKSVRGIPRALATDVPALPSGRLAVTNAKHARNARRIGCIFQFLVARAGPSTRPERGFVSANRILEVGCIARPLRGGDGAARTTSGSPFASTGCMVPPEPKKNPDPVTALEEIARQFRHTQAEHQREGVEGSLRRRHETELAHLEERFESLLKRSVGDPVLCEEWRQHLHGRHSSPGTVRKTAGRVTR